MGWGGGEGVQKTKHMHHAQNPSSAAQRPCIPTLVISNPGHVCTHRTALPVGAPTGGGETGGGWQALV